MFGRLRSEKRLLTAIEGLQESLETLRTKVGELESANRKLELEWVETYDKVRHQLSRMAKRGTLGETTAPTANDAPADAQGEQMDPVSASIHARRRRGFLQPPNPEK